MCYTIGPVAQCDKWTSAPVGHLGYDRAMYELVFDPEDAYEALDGLLDTDPVLYNRVYDLIDAIRVDPRTPQAPGRTKAMVDLDGEPLLGVCIRSPRGEVAVLWGVRTDSDGDFVKVAYIGDNVLRL